MPDTNENFDENYTNEDYADISEGGDEIEDEFAEEIGEQVESGGGAFTPEGFVMILGLGVPLDAATVLAALLGAGLASKIVLVIASAIFIPWQISKVGLMSAVKGKGPAAQARHQSRMQKLRKRIIDKTIKRLLFKLIPYFGDFTKSWTKFAYDTLEGKF